MYVGQQLTGSIPPCVAHRHTGMSGHAIGAATSGHTGHRWMGQHVTGSVPTTTGSCPPAQASSGIGQATGLAGSHAGGAGTHCDVHVCPVQLPVASQRQVASPGGQVHPGAALPTVGAAPAVPPTAPPPELIVPAGEQPQPMHVVAQR